MGIAVLNNVVKRYDQNLAVDNISLEIDKGEIFGFLGPNGAGKTTTIHLICGLLRPDAGDIVVDGIRVAEDPLAVKRRLGLVPQEIAVFDELSAWENIEFFGKLAGLRGKELKERVAEALEFVGLTDKGKQAPKRYSGGMKRRLNIACALVHHPKIIIMDEPTVGIDPQSRAHILESVCRLNQMGSTVIYTSHYMEEVEAVCNRVAIVDHGRLIACGTKRELQDLVAHEERIMISLAEPNYGSVAEIKDLVGVKEAHIHDETLEILVADAQLVLQDILLVLARHNVRIRSVNMVEPDLESLFLSLTGRQLRD